jgi:hypothetical protein
VKARKYTGTADGVATGRRAGMVAFIDEIQKRSGGALWNNGDFLVRDVKGKAGQMSVHATGRAVDLSYRYMRSNGKGSATRGIPNGGRKEAIRWCRLLVQNADLLGIECVLDYFPMPHGRGWRCNRRAWIRYDVKTISGGGGGDWLHVELSPAVADDAAAMRKAFTQLVPLDN